MAAQRTLAGRKQHLTGMGIPVDDMPEMLLALEGGADPQRVQGLLEILAVIDVPGLRLRDKKGDVFSDLHHSLLKVQQTCQQLVEVVVYWNECSGWEEEDEEDLENLLKILKQYGALWKHIHRGGNLADGGQSVLSKIQVNYTIALQMLTPYWLAYLQLNKQDDQTAQQAQAALADVKKTKEEAGKVLANTQEEVDKILASTQTAAAKIGVAKYAGIFQKESQQHQKAARWFGAGCVLGVGGLAGLLGWLVTDKPPVLDNWYQLVVHISPRVLLVSLGFYTLAQLVKQFNAARHLASLNQHRTNSMQTFETFVQATRDPQTKDAVLLQAARSIFRAGETGYLGKNAGDGGLSTDTVRLMPSNLTKAEG